MKKEASIYSIRFWFIRWFILLFKSHLDFSFIVIYPVFDNITHRGESQYPPYGSALEHKGFLAYNCMKTEL